MPASTTRPNVGSTTRPLATVASPSMSPTEMDEATREAARPSAGRVVAEEDLQRERERWMQMCMHEVWKLENSAFERIQRHMDEASAKLKSTLAGEMEGLMRTEKGERALEVLEIRRELRESKQVESDVAGLRRELTAFRGEWTTTQSGLAADSTARVSLVEAGLADLREEVRRVGERQEVQKASTTTDLRRVLDEQASRANARALEEAASRESNALGTLRSELKQDLERLRSELEDCKARGAETTPRHEFEAASRETLARIDDLNRELASQRQDNLSETTVLRGRLEAAVGERDSQLSRVETLQLALKEEQSRHSSDLSALAARTGALEAVERQPRLESAAPATSPETSPQLLARLEMSERQLSALPATFNAEISALRARISEAEEVARRAAFVTPSMQDRGGVDASAVLQLQHGLEEARNDVERLAGELREERRERCKVFADFSQLTEDVARAATNSIETAHRRFQEELEMPKGLVRPRANVVSTPRTSIEDSVSRTSKPPSECDFTASFSAPGSRHEVASLGSRHSAGASDDPRTSISGLARLMGERDAELREEFTSRIKLLTAELRGEILGKVSSKVAAVETTVNAELRQVKASLGQRLANLEVDMRCVSLAQTGDTGRLQTLGRTIAQELVNVSGAQPGREKIEASALAQSPTRPALHGTISPSPRGPLPSAGATGTASSRDISQPAAGTSREVSQSRRLDAPARSSSPGRQRQQLVERRVSEGPGVGVVKPEGASTSSSAATAVNTGDQIKESSQGVDPTSIKASLQSLMRTISNSGVLRQGAAGGAPTSARQEGGTAGQGTSSLRRSEVPLPGKGSPRRNGGSLTARSGNGAEKAPATAAAAAPPSPQAQGTAATPTSGQDASRPVAAAATGVPRVRPPGCMPTGGAAGGNAGPFSARSTVPTRAAAAAGMSMTPSAFPRQSQQAPRTATPQLAPARGSFPTAPMYMAGGSR